MKHKLVIILPALALLAFGSWVLANDPTPGGGNDWHGRGGGHHPSLERITDQLNLTPDQRAKVQPIVDQARPQIEAIHREAMEKTKQVMDNAMAQIRPILTSDQQTKLDQMKNDRPGRDGHGPRHHRPGEDASDDSGDGD